MLFRDLRALRASEFLDTLDPKRRAVIEQWQKRAGQEESIAYDISAPFLGGSIVISAKSEYRSNDADQCVAVERYVTGEVQNVGGATRPNAHIKLPDGTTLIVATEKKVLKNDPQNRIYKKAMLRIRAQYNVVTRELKDAQLLEFVEYAPDVDADDMERLAKRGEQAWKDVEDATAWVDELRGRD